MDTNAVLLSIQDKLPKDPAVVMGLRSKLDAMSDEERADASNRIMMVNFKSPILAFCLSFFLGGFAIDRFYAGQVGLGIAKLLVCILTLWTIGGIWCLVDWFLIMGVIRKHNYMQLQMVL